MQAELERSVVFSPPASRLECFSTSDMMDSVVNQRDQVYKSYNGKEYVGNSNIVSDVKSSALNQQHDPYNCHKATDLRMMNASFSKPDHPSTVLQSKEPELYRNRRTQRIRAFEEKLMAGELSFPNTVDDATYETSGREDGEVKGICRTPTFKADNRRTTEKKCVLRADSSWHQVQITTEYECLHKNRVRFIYCIVNMYRSLFPVGNGNGIWDVVTLEELFKPLIRVLMGYIDVLADARA
ncbi:hypothetical protein Vadar_032830 [Vaccinium darrowii]|uniref:Uncharacterized protein n=1 Tax=Vaccinium darrowii TaxID=229202 RepID=A0ACB7ZNC5_9ERIC|nr:hypothetical protein Vadar_032830 [Vaccinium darrowii]